VKVTATCSPVDCHAVGGQLGVTAPVLSQPAGTRSCGRGCKLGKSAQTIAPLAVNALTMRLLGRGLAWLHKSSGTASTASSRDLARVVAGPRPARPRGDARGASLATLWNARQRRSAWNHLAIAYFYLEIPAHRFAPFRGLWVDPLLFWADLPMFVGENEPATSFCPGWISSSTLMMRPREKKADLSRRYSSSGRASVWRWPLLGIPRPGAPHVVQLGPVGIKDILS
jgi:hypothetical protein